ncbi:MAG: tRNA-intron lyase [Candidatus Diapherotrites archaeon]
MALLIDNKVLVDDRKLADQLQQKGFGERCGREFVLDLYEAAYLLEKGKIEITGSEGAQAKGKKEKKKKARALGFEEILGAGSALEKNFYTKFIVYRDLRERGYCIKTGFKFGFDFRVYPRGKMQGQEHSQWVINVATQQGKWSMPEFSRMVRLSGNLKTVMLQAVVDAENDINYYEVKRVTP